MQNMLLIPLLVVAALGQPKAPKDDPVAARKYSVALGFQKKQLHQQAADRWKQFLADYPQDRRAAGATHHLGVCQIQLNQYAEAAASFRVILSKHPKFPALDSAQFNLGLALYNQALTTKKIEDFKTASNEFGQLPAKFAKSKLAPNARFYQAECLSMANEPAAAVPIYQQILKVHPKSPLAPQVSFALGAAQQDLKQHQQAAATFQALLQQHPKHELANDSRLRLGLSQLAEKKFAEAEKTLAAAAAAKDFASADYALIKHAESLFEQKKFPQAADQYESLPKRFASSSHIGAALLAAGKSRFLAGQLPQALANFTAVIAQKKPQAAEAAYWRGQTLQSQKKPAEAVKAFEEALSTYPKSPFVVLYKFGRIEAISAIDKRREEAVGLFVQFAKENPQHEKAPEAMYQAAWGAFSLGKHSLAKEHSTSFLSNKQWAKHALTPDVLMVAAESHLQEKPPLAAQAEQFYRRVLAEYPKHAQAPRARLGAGESLAAQNKLDPAAGEFQKLVQEHPQNPLCASALYQLGEIRKAQKQYDQAIAHYQQAAAKFPQSEIAPSALLAAGGVFFETGKTADAEKNLDQLLKKYPQSAAAPRGRYLRGACRLQKKNFAAGLEDFAAYLKTKPKGEEALDAQFAAARCQAGLKKFAEAAAGMQKLVQEHPDYSHLDAVYYELAFAYLDGKKETEAANAFRELAVKRPQSPRAAESWYRVGEHLEKNQKVAEAAEAFRQGLKTAQKPFQDKLQFTLATVEHRQKQFAAAAQTLQTLLKETPQSELRFAAEYLLGESYFAQKKHREALEAFGRILASKDEGAKTYLPQARYRSGVCAANVEDWKASQQHNAALIEAFPKFEQLAEARYGLGVALQKQNKLDEARTVFQQVTEKHPDTETAAKSWFMMGQCFFAEKKYKPAIDCFSEAAFGFEHKEWQPLSLFEAGRCFIQLKDHQAARKMLAAVVSDFPQHPRAKDAQTLLKDLDKQ